MKRIQIEHDPGKERLEALGVSHWGVWTREASTFPWTYDSEENLMIQSADR